jgi:alpha-1,2-mannosyltransferase
VQLVTARWDVRRVLLVVGAVLFVAALFELAGSTRMTYTRDWPVDYDINLVAAHRLVDRDPLYDRVAARAEGIDRLGDDMAKTGKSLFSSYIGDPAVALTHVPFLPFGHETGASLFRLLSVLEMVGAILLVSRCLSPPSRAPAALIALAALCFGFPLVKGLSLGQGTGLVMLALAVGVYGVARERWGLAGVGLGVATALKLSPGLLVLYLLLRGKTRAVKSAIVSAVALTVAAAAVGRPDDILVWLRDVSPHVSKGTVSAFNQSVVGALARLTSSAPDFWSHASPGAWYLVAYAIWGLALFGLWRMRRGRPVDPLELGVLILVVLVAGPLSWDHYYAWALLPLVLVLDLERWRGRRVAECVVLVGVLLVATWWTRNAIPVPSVAAVRDDWWERVRTIRYVGAALGYLGVAVWMLARPGRGALPATECDDGRTAALGAAREVVAGGVHRRG